MQGCILPTIPREITKKAHHSLQIPLFYTYQLG